MKYIRSHSMDSSFYEDESENKVNSEDTLEYEAKDGR